LIAIMVGRVAFYWTCCFLFGNRFNAESAWTWSISNLVCKQVGREMNTYVIDVLHKILIQVVLNHLIITMEPCLQW